MIEDLVRALFLFCVLGLVNHELNNLKKATKKIKDLLEEQQQEENPDQSQ